MAEKIYLIDGSTLKEMTEEPYKDEPTFQKMLEDHPVLSGGRLIT